jgi:hypothetical protein
MRLIGRFLIPAGVALFGGCAATPPAGPPLALRTGTWEVSTNINEAETRQPSQRDLNRLPPEVRAQIERIRRESTTVKAEPTLVCVTDARFDVGTFGTLLLPPGNVCTVKAKFAGATHLDAKIECPTDSEYASVRLLQLDAVSRESVRGKIVVPHSRSRGVVDLRGQWKGDVCATSDH